MEKEKEYCRACHQTVSESNNIFQHHKICAKEMLDAFYCWSDLKIKNIEEYSVIRSLLAFCMTYLNHFRTMMKKMPSDSIETNLSELEKLILKKDISKDYFILWNEISKTYPELANALNDLKEVLY